MDGWGCEARERVGTSLAQLGRGRERGAREGGERIGEARDCRGGGGWEPGAAHACVRVWGSWALVGRFSVGFVFFLK